MTFNSVHTLYPRKTSASCIALHDQLRHPFYSCTGVLQILAIADMFTTTIAVRMTGAILMEDTEVPIQFPLTMSAATNQAVGMPM